MIKEYDVVILGGGAGLKLARPAANMGYKVAVVEPGPLGGTCLNRGCIPSKMLIHPADVIQQVKEGSSVQLKLSGQLQIDLKALSNRVNQTVDDESNSIIPLMEDHPNIDFYTDYAKFIDPHTLQVGNDRIKGKKIYIVTGARPFIPDIAGLEDVPYITSTELLRADNLPKKMTIIGGGYIACELGHYLEAAGVEVVFVHRSPFLKQLDATIQQAFQEAFKRRFECHLGEPSFISYENETFKVQVAGKTLESDGLLIAAGAIPNTDHLGLDVTSIQTDSRGFIQVDEHLETSQKNIFAYGDVIGRCMFRHSANFEGEYLFYEHFVHPENHEPIDYPYVPYGVFSWPQIGGVGKTEEELKKMGVEYVVGLNLYKNSAMGMAMQPHDGLVKLLFDQNTQKLLGAHILGEQATTMIHVCIAFMNLGATLDDMLRTIYIHPALPEIVRNAARKARALFQKQGV